MEKDALPPYEWRELLEVLEKIREEGDGLLNIPKALYAICLRIKELENEGCDY